MNKEMMQKREGNALKIDLKNGYHYTGTVKAVSEHGIEVKDKYGDTVWIAYESISKMKEHEGDVNDVEKQKQR